MCAIIRVFVRLDIGRMNFLYQGFFLSQGKQVPIHDAYPEYQSSM